MAPGAHDAANVHDAADVHGARCKVSPPSDAAALGRMTLMMLGAGRVQTSHSCNTGTINAHNARYKVGPTLKQLQHCSHWLMLMMLGATFSPP